MQVEVGADGDPGADVDGDAVAIRSATDAEIAASTSEAAPAIAAYARRLQLTGPRPGRLDRVKRIEAASGSTEGLSSGPAMASALP